MLFVEEDFIGHSGGKLHWKLECDAISSPEWKCIAKMIMEHEKRPFCAAIGIPRGGVELSRYLNEYATGNHDEHPYLICDDVLTTGGSMEDFTNHFPDYVAKEQFKKRKPNYFGWVVFARNKPQDWINALFQMPYK